MPPPNPLQQPDIYYPGLESRPWHDPSRFSWTPFIEEQAPVITSEMSKLLRYGNFSAVGWSGGLAARGSWIELRLCAQGVWSEKACALAPVTTNAVRQIPGTGSAGLVACTAVTAGTHLVSHCGPDNARLRCHLGLRIPPGCSIRVGHETRTWRENKVIIFDDSFEHEVHHAGLGIRLVLLFDIWHPDLTAAEIEAIIHSRT